MDIEESSVPYRAFLRSGSYPVMSQRVVRSGGVLVRAAGWFALVVGAASAGYSTTQRFVTPTAAEPSELPRPRVSHAAMASALPALRPTQAPGLAQEPVQPEPSADPARSAPLRSSAVTQGTRALGSSNASARKRTGAVVGQDPQPTAATSTVPELEASLAEASRAERIAERVRALDSATQAEPESQPSPQSDGQSAIDAVLRAHSEHQVLASPTPSQLGARALGEPAARESQALAKSSPPAPRAPSSARAAEPNVAPSLPLTATAKIDTLVVRGPLSAASVRRSVERVRPTLSECYNDAAQRAGHNRFAPVRVQVTIDEAGRVKTLPKIDGAQLPGFAECLSTALSKLVCQAPDTGTARAAITLGFAPERH